MIANIQLGKISNIFWTNGSRDVPKKLVGDNNFGAPQKCKINWSSHTSGTIVLVGKWNYAKYCGSYYFLDIVMPLDNNEKRFTYTIYRDEWAEFIVTNKSVKGTLIKTNDEKILWKKLQTTSSTLVNFGKTEIVGLSRPSHYTRARLGIISLKEPVASQTKLKSWVVTRGAFERFFSKFVAAKNNQSTIYNALFKSAGSYNKVFGDSTLYTACELMMTEVDHWSHDIFGWLVDWLKENKGYLNICVIDNEESAGIKTWLDGYKNTNDVSVVYCIEKALGGGLLSRTVEGNSFIEEVDLSTLTSIELVSKIGTSIVGVKNVLDFFAHTPAVGSLFGTGSSKVYSDSDPDDMYWYGNLGAGLAGYANTFRYGGIGVPISSTGLKHKHSIGSSKGAFFSDVGRASVDPADASVVVGSSFFVRPDFFVKDDDGNPTTKVNFVANYKKIVSAQGVADYVPTAVQHDFPVSVDVGDIIIHDAATSMPDDKWKGVVLFGLGCYSNGFFDGKNVGKWKMLWKKDELVAGKTWGDLAATEFQFGRLNLGFCESFIIPDFLSSYNVETDDLHQDKSVVDVRYNVFSPFFLNFDHGKPKKTIAFKDVALWSRNTIEHYIKRLQIEPRWWEHRRRHNTSEPWPVAPVDGGYTVTKPWKYPRDPITDDWAYTTGHSGYHWHKIYVYSADKLDWYTLAFTNQVVANECWRLWWWGYWEDVPKTTVSPRTGKYVTWGIGAYNTANYWYYHHWSFDILGASDADKQKYLSNHVANSDYSYNTGSQVNGLSQIIYMMYRRYSRELAPFWDEKEKGFFISWPTEKDFQNGVQIFDLVGTEYFMVVNKAMNAVKPRISLIIKNNALVQTSGGSPLVCDKHPPITDVLVAINQQNSIFLYGHVFDIKTKLTFDDGENNVDWSLRFTPYTLGLSGVDEYYSYTFKGPLEYIEDRFTVNKVQKAIVGNGVEMSRLLMERDMYNAQRKMDLNVVENVNINNRTSLNNAVEDFSIAKDAANRGWWAGLLTGGIAGGAAGVMGVAMGSNNTKTASWAGKAMGGAGAAMAVAGSTVNSINSAFAIGESNYKNARDLDARASQMGKQIEIDRNQADHTHKYAEIRMRKELARISSHRVDPSITDRNVLEGFLKSHQRSICHLVHSTPSPKILEHLKLFFNEYGVDLIAENYVVDSNYFGDDLVEDRILQFTSIVSDDITDINLLRNLQGRFANGVKIKI